MQKPAGPDTISLENVIVRPVRSHERSRWDALMATYHYLGFRQMPGESIRYVAELGQTWVALLGWASAAFKCGPRDRWLGWAPEQQWRRLPLVACNQRFLLLADGVPNLASRVLSLNVKRLSRDWQAFYGHPLALAETFVDPRRFRGTCYRAAGWLTLGETSGFRRNAGRYYHHGHAKLVLVYPLVKSVQRALASSFLPPNLQNGALATVDLNEINLSGEGGLREALAGVEDKRKPRGVRHTQLSVILTATCACLAGARSYTAIAEWAKDLTQGVLKRLGCRYHYDQARYLPPSEPTIRRILQSADVGEVDRRTGEWFAKRAMSNAIALDGKTLRGSGHGQSKAIHLLSAIQHEEGAVVAQQAVSEKSNEITAAKPLLEGLDIAGKVVTADAMHTQTDLAHFIVEDKKADYVFTVKGNQPSLLQAIEDLPEDLFSPSIRNL